MEARSHEELFDRFFDRLPKEFIFETRAVAVAAVAVAGPLGTRARASVGDGLVTPANAEIQGPRTSLDLNALGPPDRAGSEPTACKKLTNHPGVDVRHEQGSRSPIHADPDRQAGDQEPLRDGADGPGRFVRRRRDVTTAGRRILRRAGARRHRPDHDRRHHGRERDRKMRHALHAVPDAQSAEFHQDRQDHDRTGSRL